MTIFSHECHGHKGIFNIVEQYEFVINYRRRVTVTTGPGNLYDGGLSTASVMRILKWKTFLADKQKPPPSCFSVYQVF